MSRQLDTNDEDDIVENDEDRRSRSISPCIKKKS